MSDQIGVPSVLARTLPVRVWAELGRVQMPTAQAVGLRPGSVVELDAHADAALDVFVNGRRFATGKLVVLDDGEWAIEIASVAGPDGEFVPPSAAQLASAPPAQLAVVPDTDAPLETDAAPEPAGPDDAVSADDTP
jgi:hypothetical protein